MSVPTNSQRQYTAFDSVLDRLLNVVTVMAVIADGVRRVCDALGTDAEVPPAPLLSQGDA